MELKKETGIFDIFSHFICMILVYFLNLDVPLDIFYAQHGLSFPLHVLVVSQPPVDQDPQRTNHIGYWLA